MTRSARAGLTSRRLTSWRRRLYEILEQGAPGDRVSTATNRAIVVLIIATVIATVLESVPDLDERYSGYFLACELLATIAFTSEYALRLWTAVDHPPHAHLSGSHARLRFATSLPGLIDLIAVLPFWLAFVITPDLKLILVVRLIRFLKLIRYSPAMRSLLDVLYAERRALLGCFVILCGTTIMAAALMHMAERHVQPDKFGTIPQAMWWAIVTLGTVGYGDAVPVTTLGRMLAGATIFAGLLMVALPVGIVATAFSNEVHRREFIITWSMLARIPLFGELSASQIADVMKYLRAQKVEAGVTITRRGEPAHAMYLIADGEVEIRLPDRRIRVATGHFFGEVAAIRRARRSATIVAITPTRLLVLDAVDLHALMDREPQIAARIRDAARTRLAHEVDSRDGDLVAEELSADQDPPSQPQD